MFVPAATIGLATPVADGVTGNSLVINPQGMTRGSVGLESSHGGVLSVQRYVDSLGANPLGAPLTDASATPFAVGWSDGLPCGSIVVSFQNSAGAAANLTNIVVNLSP